MLDQTYTKILGVKDEIFYFWNSLSFSQNPFFIIDILIVAFIIYWVYIFLKETRAMRILYGILFLIILFFISKLLNLVALNYLLQTLTTMFVVAIPIVFQPELRSLLEKLGQADIVSDFKKISISEIDEIINIITNSVKKLSITKTGALLVIAQKIGIKNIIESGTKIDAKISEDLILTIFQPKSALHDGAVIIKGNKISAAGCMLPLTEHEFDKSFGTRHRAAMGISEQSDAIVIVVSEEKGTISVASKGVLNQDIDINKLRNILEILISQGRLKNKNKQSK